MRSSMPLPPLAVRLATTDDLATVVGLEENATAWLRARGIDPGEPPRPLAEIFAEAIAQRQMYVATLDGQPVGKLALTVNDDGLWADLPASARYVHGLMTHRDYAGRAIGLAMLRWAERTAADAGCAWLRLDCMGDNPALRAYYERAGFTHRGDVALARRVAARYERATGAV